jgi:hypothetical protein
MHSHEYKKLFEDLFYVLYMILKVRHEAWQPIFFGDIGLLFMKVFASIVFLRRWALMALYLCFKFLIFDKLILEEDFFKLKGPHLFQSYLHVVWNAFLLDLVRCTLLLKIWQLLAP